MAAKLKVAHDENSIRARETNTSANVMPKSSLIIMIMNTGGEKKKHSVEKATEKRKQAIYDIVTNTGATLFLLQEFWADMRSPAWVEFDWPEHLQYTGHKDASIIYDVNEVTIEEYPQKLLDDTLRELQRIGSIQQGFSPWPRMCLRKVNTKGVPVLSFICVSWHGQYKGKTLDYRKKEFECLLEYVLKLAEKKALPVIIGGDFNVKIEDIENLVEDLLILHRYTPRARRKNNIIDFYISSRSLVMSDIKALKWESQTNVDDVLLLFDHDPVVTSVTTCEAKGYKLAVKSSNAPQRESQTKVDDVQSVFDHDPVVTSLTTNEAKGYKLVVKSKSAKLKVAHLDENSIRARETNTSANVTPKSSLIIMIMNTSRKKKKHSVEKATEKRKQAIYDIVTNTGATLVLLQEFEWADMRSPAWVEFDWPERLQYTGHKDASIIYDVNEVTIEGYSQKLLDDTLRELQRIGSIQQGFSPFLRMCIKKIKTKRVPVVNFICISWHGPHNRGKLDDLKDLKEFECLLKYVLKLSENEALPVIIAGDFNVKIKDIEKLVPDSLILHRYTPTARRDENDITDFYISSRSLVMSDMKALKWESETKVDDVLLLFDHDPVVTSVTPGEAKGYKLAVKSCNAPQRESQTKVDDVQSVFDHDPVVTSLTTNEAKGYKLVVKSKSAKLKVAHLDENSIRARETNTSANVTPKSSLIIMIMNTSRKKKKHSVEKATEKRKQAIYDIVTNTGATLVLLQEFEWADMRSPAWVEFDWPERLQYTGHKDASIIYDVNEVTIEGYSQKLLQGTLEELQRIGRIQQGFSPFLRMCIKKIKTKRVPVVNFICISWHGPHNRGKLDDLKDLKEFECLLKYVLKLSENEALPVIIAGDFNVKIKDIEKLVPDSLILHRYTPTARRDENDITDFYISSRSLVMSDMKALKWESETKVDDVLLLFDHDPVVTSVTPGEAKGYKLAVKSCNAQQRESQTKNDDARPLFDPVVTSSTTDETKGYNLDVKSSNAPQRRRPHTNRNTSRLVTPPVDRCVLSSPVDGQNHSIQRLHTTSVHHIPNRRHNTDAHNESGCRYCGERNHSSKNCKHGTYWQCILI